jgi:hypothetical protein
VGDDIEGDGVVVYLAKRLHAGKGSKPFKSFATSYRPQNSDKNCQN